MATAMGKVAIRVATVHDFEQVVDMCSNLYHGLDYLPYIFPHLVEGPGVQGFLFKINGEVVAFMSTILLDRAHSVSIVAFRLKDSLQGQGLFTLLRAVGKQYLSNRMLYPRLCRAIFISEYPMEGLGCRLVLTRRKCTRVFEEVSNLSKLSTKTPQGEVTALQHEDVARLFQSPPSRWIHLFPHRQFILAERPYSVMADNLPAIWNCGLNTEFYGTKAVDGEYTLLSAGSYHFCQLGINYHLDIFGAVEISRNARRIETELLETTWMKAEKVTRTPGATTPTDVAESEVDEFQTNEEGDAFRLTSQHEIQTPKEATQTMTNREIAEEDTEGREDKPRVTQISGQEKRKRNISRLTKSKESPAFKTERRREQHSSETTVKDTATEKASVYTAAEPAANIPKAYRPQVANIPKTYRPQAMSVPEIYKPQAVSVPEIHRPQTVSVPEIHIPQPVSVPHTHRSQILRDHIFTHLQRLQPLAQTTTGKIVLNVFACDMLDDVLDDMTQDLKASEFVKDYNVCMMQEVDLFPQARS